MSTTLDYRTFFREGEESQRTYWGDKAAGCVFVAKDTGRILLAHRSDEVDFEPHTWGTWGGKIDMDETLKQAVEREVAEETGIDTAFKISPLYVYRDGSFEYHNFLVAIPFEFTPQLNWENDDSKWVEYGEWPKPLHFGMEALIQHAGHKIKKVVDLIKKKQDNMLESMDTPNQSPPAIVRHVYEPAKTNVVDSKKLADAYVVIATLWGEARGEGEIGMHAVLNVLMNRSKGDFGKVHDLCLKPKQFSIWNNVKDPGESALNLAKVQREGGKGVVDGPSYKKAMELVDTAMKGQLTDITGGATYYFNPKKASPSWAKAMTKTKSIGNHDFYKPIARLKKSQQVKEDLNNFNLSKQGLVDDGIYGYELTSSHSYLRYGYDPIQRLFFLYNVGTPNEADKNKGYAKALLEHFFQIIKQSRGSLDTGPFTTSGNAYIKHVIERLAQQYGVRLI